MNYNTAIVIIKKIYGVTKKKNDKIIHWDSFTLETTICTLLTTFTHLKISRTETTIYSFKEGIIQETLWYNILVMDIYPDLSLLISHVRHIYWRQNITTHFLLLDTQWFSHQCNICHHDESNKLASPPQVKNHRHEDMSSLKPTVLSWRHFYIIVNFNEALLTTPSRIYVITATDCSKQTISMTEITSLLHVRKLQ